MGRADVGRYAALNVAYRLGVRVDAALSSLRFRECAHHRGGLHECDQDGRGSTSGAVADLRGDGSTEALVANYAAVEVAGLIGCLQTSKDGRCDLYCGAAS